MKSSIPAAAVAALGFHGLCILVPTVVALARRRFGWHDPVGQVAFCWLFIAISEALTLSRYIGGFPPKTFDIAAVVFGLLPLLLLTPFLIWIGPHAARWRWWAIGAWCVTWMAVVTVLENNRMILTIGFPVMSAGMCALALWALSVRVRSDTLVGDVRLQPWFWILLGHVVYFGVNIFRGPLIETLVARQWDTDSLFYAYNGIVLVYTIGYLAIARGLWLGEPAVPATRNVSRAA